MWKQLFACALAIPLVGITVPGCGDDGGGGERDAGRPDAREAPEDGGGEPGPDAGIDYDLTIESIAGGRMQAFEGYEGVSGAAQMVRMAEALRAELYVEGLKASTEYVAHVHELPCGEDQAGTHYKHDPTIAAEEEANEIWLHFTTDADGRGMASTQQLGKVARMDAQSIVVHDPDADGAKMACANLFFDDPADATIELQGAFTPVSGAPAGDQDIGGSVTMTVSPEAGETFINFDIEGLDESATYMAQVHELPCDVNQGGERYKRDTTVMEEDEDNEIWPNPATQEQTFPHALRYDAQSLVIYRMEAGNPMAACANLVRATEIPEYVTEGTATVLPDVDEQFADLEATAKMTRKKDGTTEATLDVTGLPEGVTDFGAQVHDGTCNLDPPGGPHYKLDPSVVAEVEANEIWLNFDANAEGTAMTSTAKDAHLARPDAISVVIHEPVTDTRLVCIDLQ